MKLAAKRLVLRVIDLLLFVPVALGAVPLKLARRLGIQHLPASLSVLRLVGVFPINRHYYEPRFDYRGESPVRDTCNLPGIDWNVTGQVAQLGKLTFASELKDLPMNPGASFGFYMANNSFEAGDAEYWYQTIRAMKPARIVEIGSGFSTLLARMAIAVNQRDSGNYTCVHQCIEPYEMPWLETTGAEIIRRRAEEMEVSFFASLESGDILFVDSSHMIRPYGDVLFEILEVLPVLRPGVVVHFHDIFSPRNYPHQWLARDVRFWNEQYLLEAFLSGNSDWKVLGALNMLKHERFDELKMVAPHLTQRHEPGSFYIERVP